jgi:hypothetical protein
MGDVYWGLHSPLASLAAQQGITQALESGTFFANGALQLAALFDRVWTVEREPSLHEFCRCTYRSVSNIQFLLGESPKIITEVLASEPAPFLFVLDAHWFPVSPLNASLEKTQCPVVDEIIAISKSRSALNGDVIIIDDADMFLGSLPKPFRNNEFPSITSIISLLRDSFRAECVSVIDDVIVAASASFAASIDAYAEQRNLVGGPNSKRLGR